MQRLNAFTIPDDRFNFHYIIKELFHKVKVN
jgi:hypothetical protein